MNSPSLISNQSGYDYDTSSQIMYTGLPSPPITSTSSTTTSSYYDRTMKFNLKPSLSTTSSIFPPTQDMIIQAKSKLQASESSFKVIYAGDAIYKSDKKLLNKIKRAHFVLTNTQLLIFKSSQKARSEINMFDQNPAASVNIDKDRVFLNVSDIYAVQSVATVANTFRIEYLHAQSGQALAHTLTVDSEKEIKLWIDALRRTIKIHHPQIHSISSTERFRVLERMDKQKDSLDNVKMYKVVFKEKHYTKMTNEVPREVFLPVILAIGKFSFYLLPISVADNDYLKSVERDRFGLLSILSIRYEDIDDTVIIEVKQIGKSNRQLVFASTFCEDIVQSLYRSVDSIIPGLADSLYTDKVPVHIRQARVMPLPIPADPEDGHGDDEVQRFHTTLRAFCASMNLNKTRFNFSIHGPLKTKIFTLMPPNEVNRTAPVYDKYELLALLRTIQHHNIFIEISLADQPLDCLEKWRIQKNHGWIYNHSPFFNSENVLSIELFEILTCLKVLRKLDLTNCSIGLPIEENAPPRKNSALATLGIVMKSGKTNLSRISIGKNRITMDDLMKLMQGIKGHKKSIKEIHLNECGLDKDMIENVLRTLYEKSPEQIISLDLTQEKTVLVNPLMIERMIPTLKRLEYLRMAGHELLLLERRFRLESSQLKVLDLSNSRMDNNNVARLCSWIQTLSFQSIKELHLGNCGLNGRHTCDILISISQSGNRSMHLNLERNPIMKDVAHLPKLQSALIQNEGPSSISFARLEWDDSTLREFIDCLRDNTFLTHLDLSDISMKDTEEISEDTIRMLTSFFERNSALKELELNFKHNKAKRLSLAAKQLKSIIGNAIIKALPGLHHNKSLMHLDISGLNLEDAGAMALSRVLKTNRCLQSIIIDENNISIDGYRGFIKVIEENATQVIHVPSPQIDLRHQLKYLSFRIEELVLSENEAQFFLIHTSTGDKKRTKKHELEMMVQERKTCEMAVKNFEQVIQTLGKVVLKNARDYEQQSYLNMEYRLQAEATAQSLARAQIRIQERAPNIKRNVSGSAYSVTSSANSTRSYRHRDSVTGSQYSGASSVVSYSNHPDYINSYQDLKLQMTRPFRNGSVDDLVPPTPNTYDTYFNARESVIGSFPTPPPSQQQHAYQYEQSPGFLDDFGYVDDFEQGIIDPHMNPWDGRVSSS